jgi:hypothetical protein
MNDGPPKIIAFEHDDDRAAHVGLTADGRQFFLTTPFEPAVGGRPGCEFVAMYLFDAGGKLLEARIDGFGARAVMDGEGADISMNRDCKSLATCNLGASKWLPSRWKDLVPSSA